MGNGDILVVGILLIRCASRFILLCICSNCTIIYLVDFYLSTSTQQKSLEYRIPELPRLCFCDWTDYPHHIPEGSNIYIV